MYFNIDSYYVAMDCKMLRPYIVRHVMLNKILWLSINLRRRHLRFDINIEHIILRSIIVTLCGLRRPESVFSQ